MGDEGNVEPGTVRGAGVLALALLVFAGCSADRSGGGPEPGASRGGPEPLGPVLYVETGVCPRRVHAVRPDQRTPAGFTFDEVVARMGPTRRVRVSWAGPTEEFDAFPPAAELAATVDSVPDSQALRWHDAPPPVLDGANLPPFCPSELQFDATMHVLSDDGTFAEAWPLMLHARYITPVDFDIQLGGLAHGGSWRVGYRAPVAEESWLVQGIYADVLLYARFLYEVRPVSCPSPTNCYSAYEFGYFVSP